MIEKCAAYLFAFICCLWSVAHSHQSGTFAPGKPWNDISGQPINAHHGCVLAYKGLYYWYGEHIARNSQTKQVTYDGIACYSSPDLLHWQNKGLVFLSSGLPGSQHIVESPRVLYNKTTKKFVMWMHLGSDTSNESRCGIAIGSAPAGLFNLASTDAPNGHFAGEITTFLDDDGKAYLFYVADNNLIFVSRLNKDYTGFLQEGTPVLFEKGRGAPVVFKHHNKYYLITSWAAFHTHGKGLFSVADHITGPWKTIGSPFMGPGAVSSYQSRGTFALPLNKPDVTMLYIADRWNKGEPEQSTYVWLPMGVNEEGLLEIPWQDSWNFIK